LRMAACVRATHHQAEHQEQTDQFLHDKIGDSECF
jgi:hypothetical protein